MDWNSLSSKNIALDVWWKGFSSTFALGEMAERSNAAVLKTVVPKGTGGSNPSLSAKSVKASPEDWLFYYQAKPRPKSRA